MPDLGNIVKKALYLGIGIASYAGEKAGVTLAQLRTQAQKLADEMVARGEMKAEEARKFVDEMIAKAQQPQVDDTSEEKPSEPRRIEILEDDEALTKQEATPNNNVEEMRKQVQALQDELRRLQRE